MISKTISVYDAQSTQDTTDEGVKSQNNSKQNITNNKNKQSMKNHSNTSQPANNSDRSISKTPSTDITTTDNNTGHSTNSRETPGDNFRFSAFRTALQNELYKTVIKTMTSNFKKNIHKKDTLPRNLNYQINKYCLIDTHFNDLNTGTPKDNLTEYINMEELEQLRKDFNNNIIKILENNKSTYLEEAQIDGFYTENIIPDVVGEAFDKLTKTDTGTSTYLLEFKSYICKDIVDWFNTTLKVEYGQIEADFAHKKLIKTSSNKNTTTNNTNINDKNNNNKRPLQNNDPEPTGKHNLKQRSDVHINRVTPYNNGEKYNNIASSSRQYHPNIRYDGHYDHFDRHVQPTTGIYPIYPTYDEYSVYHNPNDIHTQITTTQYKKISTTDSYTGKTLITPFNHISTRDIKQLPATIPQTIQPATTQTCWPIRRRKRKNRCKRNEITHYYKHQTKLKKLPCFFHRITNKGIHNFSQKILTTEEECVLSLGFKFIIRPPPNTLNELMQCYNNFVRLIRIKNQMLGCNGYLISNSHSVYVPNKAFVPNKGGQALENYIAEVYSNLQSNYNNLPLAYKFKQSIPKIFSITIEKLKKDSTIQICSADKNLGICIVDREWYEQEALRQLLDVNTYMKVERLPSTTYFITIITNIFSKNKKQHGKLLSYFLQTINRQNNKNYKPDECYMLQIARFYLTIKIHKDPIIGRPIVASVGSFTYYISSYLDKVLQPVMKQQASYLRNTNDLIIDIETKQLFKNISGENMLYTADIKDMYPSINIVDGLLQLKLAIQEFNAMVDTTRHIQTDFIIDLAHFVLTNNYFIFGHNTYWLQTSGTAMGTPLAVTFACIYIGQLEKQIFNAPQYINCLPLYYKRYIDDIFAIFKNKKDMENFHNIFNTLRQGNIKLITTHTGICVTFMDLNISINNNNIEVKIYQKPQNSYLYLPPSSFHQKHVFHNTIIAELKRYKLKCTHSVDYEDIKTDFYHRLIARGYDSIYINKIFNQCTSITREQLISDLQSKMNNNKQQTNNKPMIFVTTNTPLTKHLDFNKMLQPTEQLQSNPLCQLLFTKHKGSYRPITAHKRTKNLREYLTKSTYTHELQTLTTNNSTDEKL